MLPWLNNIFLLLLHTTYFSVNVTKFAVSKTDVELWYLDIWTALNEKDGSGEKGA